MISIAYGGCKMDLNFVEYYLNDINSLRPELRSEFLDLFMDLYRRGEREANLRGEREANQRGEREANRRGEREANLRWLFS